MHSWAILLVGLSLLQSETTAVTDTDPVRVERYEYLSQPKGDERADKREVSRPEILIFRNHIAYRFDIEAPGLRERGELVTDRDGLFRHGWRIVEEHGEVVQADTLWRDERKLKVEVTKKGEVRLKDFDLPNDKPTAVDASLLLWMRQFPFGSDESIDVFMVDFDHHKVNVSVDDLGEETIEVPAGAFTCRHLRVTVKVFGLRPKIHFWLNAESPHFLVRHEGKRGPFSASYRTELIRIHSPE